MADQVIVGHPFPDPANMCGSVACMTSTETVFLFSPTVPAAICRGFVGKEYSMQAWDGARSVPGLSMHSFRSFNFNLFHIITCNK